MKITLTDPDGQDRLAEQPYHGAEHVIVLAPCPKCGAKEVRGNGKHAEHDEYYETSDAVCARCGAARGTIKVEFNTLFGITEDDRIASGRYGKVY